MNGMVLEEYVFEKRIEKKKIKLIWWLDCSCFRLGRRRDHRPPFLMRWRSSLLGMILMLVLIRWACGEAAVRKAAV